MKARPRLNMWWRAAIVLSGVWAVGAAIWTFLSIANRNAEFAYRMHGYCAVTAAEAGRSTVECGNELTKNLKIDWFYTLGSMGIAAVGPLILAWVLGLMALGLVRWVLAGRSERSDKAMG